MVYQPQHTVKVVINNILSKAVSREYHRNPNTMEVRDYRPINIPRAIIQNLTARCIQKTPQEVEDKSK